MDVVLLNLLLRSLQTKQLCVEWLLHVMQNLILLKQLSLQRAHRRVQINRRNASHTIRRIQQSVARRSRSRSISRIQIIQGKSSHVIVMLQVFKISLDSFQWQTMQ